ncbi:acylneuraminate cytidylyltransferase family protein [Salinimicrobium sp. HB62]|uniref:acylneuraminate cytidylyltransferase family protein n=1 Tax=Salinimicrobium sp. HB62 TaxID=3077781 RepID=UPI002D77B37F|nr:NTP transferase domain-containing protein [Salinimicrobium sp. HB62]
MKKLVAVIPVREGSQRVKSKNIRPFAGKSLLEHKLEIIKQLPVDDIVINTDSEEAIRIAQREGISFHRREPYFASSKCSNSEFHHYLAKVTEAENLLIAQVTAPLIMQESYNRAINTFYKVNCDSLMSVKVLKEFIWYNNKPLNYSIENTPNSQDLPEYLVPTFGLVIVERASMLKTRSYIGKNPHFYKVTQVEAIDIDTELDFEFAEFMFQKKFENTL